VGNALTRRNMTSEEAAASRPSTIGAGWPLLRKKSEGKARKSPRPDSRSNRATTKGQREVPVDTTRPCKHTRTSPPRPCIYVGSIGWSIVFDGCSSTTCNNFQIGTMGESTSFQSKVHTLSLETCSVHVNEESHCATLSLAWLNYATVRFVLD